MIFVAEQREFIKFRNSCFSAFQNSKLPSAFWWDWNRRRIGPLHLVPHYGDISILVQEHIVWAKWSDSNKFLIVLSYSDEKFHWKEGSERPFEDGASVLRSAPRRGLATKPHWGAPHWVILGRGVVPLSFIPSPLFTFDLEAGTLKSPRLSWNALCVQADLLTILPHPKPPDHHHQTPHYWQQTLSFLFLHRRRELEHLTSSHVFSWHPEFFLSLNNCKGWW